MQVAVVPDDLHDPRRQRATELERDLRRHEALEGVRDETGVERDGGRLSLHGRVDPAGVVPDLRGVRRDHERRIARGVHLETKHVRGVAGEIRSEACRFEELFALRQHSGRVARRDDLAVVGELTLDDPRHQVRLVGMEDDLALVWGHQDVHRLVVVVLEDPRDLEEALRRDDHLDGWIDAVEEACVTHREPVGIRGGHRHHLAGERREDSGQDGTRVVGRRDEGDFADHPPQRRLSHPGRRLVGNLRDDRELFSIHAFDVRLVRA